MKKSLISPGQPGTIYPYKIENRIIFFSYLSPGPKSPPESCDMNWHLFSCKKGNAVVEFYDVFLLCRLGNGMF